MTATTRRQIRGSWFTYGMLWSMEQRLYLFVLLTLIVHCIRSVIKVGHQWSELKQLSTLLLQINPLPIINQMSKNQSNVKELDYIVDDSVLTSHVKELMLSQ